MKRKIKSKKIVSILMAAMLAVSMTACGGNKDNATGTAQEQVKDINMTELHQKVKEAYGEDYLPSMSLDETFIKDLLGLTTDMYEEIIAEMPAVSVHIDTFVAVKAKEGQADAVETALNAYRDAQINDTMMYPANAVKIQGSQVVRHGDYVFFVCLGTIPMEIQEQGDEAMLAVAKKLTQKAVDVIDSYFE